MRVESVDKHGPALSSTSVEGRVRRRLWLSSSALILLFVVSHAEMLRLPAGVDSLGFYWMVKNLPPSSLVTDPLSAGYGFLFYFEPVLVYLHYIDLLAVPWLGNAGHHVAALVGVFGAAVLLARMVAQASRDAGIGLLAAALFLFSVPTSFDVSFTPMVHYPFSVLFALLSLRPAWNEWLGGRRVRTAAAVESALWYGLAVASKESAAALPLLIGALRLAAGTSLMSCALQLTLHAFVLVAVLAWRIAILGGFGGYFTSEPVVPANLIAAGPALLEMVWGSAYVALPIAAWLLLRAPRSLALAAVAYVASVLPFILTTPLSGSVQVGGRLILTWALLLLLIVPELRRYGGKVRLAVVVVLLLLQTGRYDGVRAAAVAELPPDAAVPKASDGPETVVSTHALWYALEHQLRPEPKPDLHASFGERTPAVAQLLGFGEGAGKPPQQRGELDLTGLEFGADARGRFHLRAAAARLRSDDPTLPSRLYLALQYDNGKTHWMVAMPVGRTRVDFPLSYSIRAVILFEPSASEVLPVHVWMSPFFRDPYPGVQPVDE